MGQVIETFAGFSGMKLRLIMIAASLVAVGLFVDVGRRVSQSQGAYSVGTVNWSASSLVGDVLTNKADNGWQTVARVGLFFLAALIFATLLRAFFKTMVSVTFCTIAVIAFLDFRGLIEPFWSTWTIPGAKQWLVGQVSSFESVVKGYFPIVAACGAGFGFGIRK